MSSQIAIGNIIRNLLLDSQIDGTMTTIDLSDWQMERAAWFKGLLEVGLEKVFQQSNLTEDEIRAISDQLIEWSKEPNSAIIVQGDVRYDTECQICIGPLVDEKLIKCGHVFCIACIDEWFKCNYTCPVCRCPVTTPSVLTDLDLADAADQINAAGIAYFGRDLLLTATHSRSIQERCIWFHWLQYTAVSYTGQDLIWLRLQKAFWAFLLE